MIFPELRIKVWLCTEPTDMRKEFDGLSAMVKHRMNEDPLSGQLFVFINKARDKIKVLYWERSGFCLWHKRLEKERFKWPEHLAGDVLTLDGQQLNWLLDGYDLSVMRPHRSLSYRSVL